MFWECVKSCTFVTLDCASHMYVGRQDFGSVNPEIQIIGAR